MLCILRPRGLWWGFVPDTVQSRSSDSLREDEWVHRSKVFLVCIYLLVCCCCCCLFGRSSDSLKEDEWVHRSKMMFWVCIYLLVCCCCCCLLVSCGEGRGESMDGSRMKIALEGLEYFRVKYCAYRKMKKSSGQVTTLYIFVPPLFSLVLIPCLFGNSGPGRWIFILPNLGRKQ